MGIATWKRGRIMKSCSSYGIFHFAPTKKRILVAETRRRQQNCFAMAAAPTSAYLDTSSLTARVSSSSLRRVAVSSRVAAFAVLTRRRPPHVVICHSESGGGCCGGSGSSSSSSGSCGSHGKNSLANLGKEFEHLVATNTLLEFEKEYISAPMEGKITRDIMNTVMDTNPAESVTEGEKFLDINEILAEANSISNGDLVFSEDSEFVLV